METQSREIRAIEKMVKSLDLNELKTKITELSSELPDKAS